MRWWWGRTFGDAGEEGEVGFQRRPGEGAAETDAEGGGGGYDEGERGEGRGHGGGRGGHGGGAGVLEAAVCSMKESIEM